MVQVDVGHAEAALRSGRAFLTEAVRDIWSEARRPARSRSSGARRCAWRPPTASGWPSRSSTRVYSAAGATAAYEGNLIQRHFQDIHVITQHLQARMAHYELVGRHWLGLPIDEGRL